MSISTSTNPLADTSTLAQTLADAKIAWDQLERDYHPLLSMVRALIGVAPNCDVYLEIWPPAFRAYNLLVPNSLNLPAMLLGAGARKDLIGLAMYATSRAAGCMYCSAHCCSFALRRGASATAIQEQGDAAEQATVAFAKALGTMPATLTPQHLQALAPHYSAADRQWLLWSVALMGFLGKFMDAMGVPLEQEAIADAQDIIGGNGWSPGKHQWTKPEPIPSAQVPTDNAKLYINVLRNAPQALWLQHTWLRGLGFSARSALHALEKATGYGFPRLQGRKPERPTIALAGVLRDQLNGADSPLGLRTKCLAGLVFAKTTGCSWLQADLHALLQVHGPDLEPSLLSSVEVFATISDPQVPPPPQLPPLTCAAVTLAKGISASPVVLDLGHPVFQKARAELSAPQLVELVVWTSVLQLIYRLYAFDKVETAPSNPG